MPKRIFLANQAWQAGTVYVTGQQIVNGTHVQQVTTAGTSGSMTPAFNTTTGVTTADNTVVWTCAGPTSAPTWIVPADYGLLNSIECIGGGGSGGAGLVGIGAGGGGGGYSRISNLFLTSGASIPYQIGGGGNPGAGGDTWFNGTTLGLSSVGAKGGGGGAAITHNSAVPAPGGPGGAAASGIGAVRYSGGDGGSAVTAAGTGIPVGAGGGGAAGPNGAGGAGGGATSTSTANASPGGGGNGGGAPGVGSNDQQSKPGGNNYLGYGAGAAGTGGSGGGNGTDGGGGGGGGFPGGGGGGNGIDWNISYGSGGGGGGGYDGGGAPGLYGGGSGGAGGGASGIALPGAQGIIVITYGSAVEGWLVVDEPTLGPTVRSSYLFLGQGAQHKGAQHSFNLQLRQRGNATYTLVSNPLDPMSAPSNYLPTLFQQIWLYDQNASGFTLVFTGLIQDFTERWVSTEGLRYIDCTAASLECVLDTIYAQPMQFVSQTCGAILSTLFNAFESGSQLSLGTIQAGPTIPLFNAQLGDKLSDLFSQLATTAQFVWGVNPQTQQIYFQLPTVTAAPFSLTSTEALWDTISDKTDGTVYRNRQAVKLSYDAFSHSMEFFIGAGQQSFTLMRPVQQATNAYVTLSTPNTATGIFSGQPNPGDTVTIGPASGVWQAGHVYGLGGIIVVNGFVQKVTTAGTSGGTIPAFSIVTGQTTTDNSVIWTCQGALGLGTGSDVYTFVSPIPAGGIWTPATAYATNAQIPAGAVVNTFGFVQKATTGGVSGSSYPAFSTTTSVTTADGSVVWTCEGPCLDNTQFGQAVIGSSVAATAQALADAINANAASRGTTISLPTWENSQCNAISVTGTGFTLQQKAAGTGYVSQLSTTATNFAWSAGQTSGGSSPQGSVGPNEGATISISVYAQGTSTSAPALAYVEGSATVTLATPLNSGTNLNVEYTRTDGNVIEVEQTPLVTALAIVTGGTGKVQQISDQSSTGLIATSSSAGLQFAQEALAAYDVPPQDIEVQLHQPGLLPGQQLTIALNSPLSVLNGNNYFIEEIAAQLVPTWPYLDNPNAVNAGHYRYTAKLIDIAQIASYMDFWLGNLGGGSGGGQGGALVATSGGAQSTIGTSPTTGGVDEQTASYLAVATDNGKLIVFNAPSSPLVNPTLTLPATPPSPQWNIFVENIGLGTLTISPNGLNLDGSASNLTPVSTNQGVYISTDGINYFTERGLSTALTNPMTTLGDVIVAAAAGAPARLAVGSDGQVLTARAAATDGVDWETPVSGAVGGAFSQTGPWFTANNSNWQNYSLVCRVRGWTLSAFPSTWTIKLFFTAGSPVVGNMVVLKTLPASVTTGVSVISSTAVTIGGVSNPTLTTPSIVTTDSVALALDNAHEFYFVIYFTNVGANASVAFGAAPATTGNTYAVSGNQTGIATLPTLGAGDGDVGFMGFFFP